MNHAPGVGSIARPVDQQSSALPLYHGCPQWLGEGFTTNVNKGMKDWCCRPRFCTVRLCWAGDTSTKEGCCFSGGYAVCISMWNDETVCPPSKQRQYFSTIFCSIRATVFGILLQYLFNSIILFCGVLERTVGSIISAIFSRIPFAVFVRQY